MNDPVVIAYIVLRHHPVGLTVYLRISNKLAWAVCVCGGGVYLIKNSAPRSADVKSLGLAIDLLWAAWEGDSTSWGYALTGALLLSNKQRYLKVTIFYV